MNHFRLSTRSLNRLDGVHKDLVIVVKRAIQLTTIDFGISEGVRTEHRQKALVKAGKSWTMKSRHIPLNGVSHAIDVVAMFQGKASWDMEDYAGIALAMRKAADEHEINITWGAVWDRRLRELTLEDGSFNDDIDAYVTRFKAKHGRRPKLDGPHFQLTWEEYPA